MSLNSLKIATSGYLKRQTKAVLIVAVSGYLNFQTTPNPPNPPNPPTPPSAPGGGGYARPRYDEELEQIELLRKIQIEDGELIAIVELTLKHFII
jgi:hypothetical protein